MHNIGSGPLKNTPVWYAACVLIPLAAIAVAAGARGTILLVPEKNNPRSALGLSTFLPGLMLAQVLPLTTDGLSLRDLLFPAAAIAAVLTLAVRAIDPQLRAKAHFLAIAFAALLAYGYGALFYINTLADTQPVRTVKGLVVCSPYKRTIMGGLDVIWNPTEKDIGNLSSNERRVQKSYVCRSLIMAPSSQPRKENAILPILQQVHRGGFVCKTVHPRGALGLEWSELSACAP